MSAPAHFRVRTAASDRDVSCRSDQPLLDAFLRNGFWLPNSCNQGTCGTCKVRVCSGEVDHHNSPEHTLPHEERAAGYALACQATPTCDAVIESLAGPETEDSTGHVLRDFTGTVVEISDIARETRRVRVALDEPLTFSAGQYVRIRVPGTDTGRQYSMANSPDQATLLEFHVRRQPGGLATDGWIFHTLTPGDTVELQGPLGDFLLDPVHGDSGMILLGGGTGLAPLKSIVVQALSADPDREIHLYHGVREEADLYDRNFFAELERSHRGLRYIPCLSEQQWDGRSGYVSDVFLEDFTGSCRQFSGYLCGPPVMVEAGIKALKRRRMAPRRIHREKFTPASTPDVATSTG